MVGGERGPEGHPWSRTTAGGGVGGLQGQGRKEPGTTARASGLGGRLVPQVRKPGEEELCSGYVRCGMPKRCSLGGVSGLSLVRGSRTGGTCVGPPSP